VKSEAPPPGPVVQEKSRHRKYPGRSKNAGAWALGTGKTQALVQTQLNLYYPSLFTLNFPNSLSYPIKMHIVLASLNALKCPYFHFFYKNKIPK